MRKPAYPSFKEAQLKLNKILSKSAFRRGTSAFRLGLIPKGISDHLPVVVKISREGTRDKRVLSWNLLADDHLYNNFLNISGSDQLKAQILKKCPKGVIYCSEERSRLHYFFSELAEYLYQQFSLKNTVHLTEDLLQKFVSLDEQASRLTRSRDAEKAIRLKDEVAAARQLIVDILFEASYEDAHEFRLAIRHSLELIYHIKNPDGALRWKNRLLLIKHNKRLVAQLLGADIICLQECSKPLDILSLFKDKAMGMQTHRINERTNDCCALFYDSQKYKVIGEPIKFAFNGSKPCIVLRLQDKVTGENFIIASMHHPGGEEEYHMPALLNHINSLRKLFAEDGRPDNTIPFYIFGDHNHVVSYFDEHEARPEECKSYFPKVGTLAGSDYGNMNRAIDGLTTNQDLTGIKLEVCDSLAVSAPAPMPFKLFFEGRLQAVKAGFARLFEPVRAKVSAVEGCFIVEQKTLRCFC